MKEQSRLASTQTDDASPQLTVIGVFEDSIDAERVLSDLRNDSVPPECVSLIVLEHDSDDTEVIRGPADISTALGSAGLVHAGDWLSHLVSLIIPDLGVALAAGPIGAILAATEADADDSASGLPGETLRASTSSPIAKTLVSFGYGTDEAGYITSRVRAGSILIGVTTPESECAGDTRRIFADQNAVHIGTNWTVAETVAHAENLIHTPVESAHPEDVVVLDSAGVLVGLCTHAEARPEARLHGKPVLDSAGTEAGTIEDLLAELSPARDGQDETTHIRYVVLGFRGLLGLRREFVAVPAEYVKLDSDPIEMSLLSESIRHAPTYRVDKPFSRHEEELICSYFGCSTYWSHS